MSALGMSGPEPPEYSYLAEWLLYAYCQISRARRFEQGVPLPLNLADVAAFAECETLPVTRGLLNRAVFALDDAALEKAER